VAIEVLKRRWLPFEEEYLKENYNNIPMKDVCKFLNRSSRSIHHRVRILNLTRKFNYWTTKETEFLRNNFGKINRKEIAQLLGRSVGSVQCRANLLNLLPKRQPRQSLRASKLKIKYGITLEDFDKVFEQQGGVCAICGKPETFLHQTGVVCRLAVDHNHKTGKIRGLLCRVCNQGLGSFKDNSENLSNAIKYLGRGV